MPTPEDNPRGTPLNASPPPVTPPSPPLCLVIDYTGGFVPSDDGEGTLPTCLLPVGHDGPHLWPNEPAPPAPSAAPSVLASIREVCEILEIIARDDSQAAFLPGAVLLALPTIRRAVDALER